MSFRSHYLLVELSATRVRVLNSQAENQFKSSAYCHPISTVNIRQHLIKADFEVALQLATELDFLFEKGTFKEKRLLCETVFKRVYLKEGRVSEVELNAPFSLIASKSKVREQS